jgi:mono/diheme cytochrome c family protein
MMMPGLTNGEADWAEYAQGLTRAALLAKSAAEAQDADALFVAGGAIYNVCRACHNKYMEQDEFQ